MLAPSSCKKFLSYIMGTHWFLQQLRAGDNLYQREWYWHCLACWLVICGWQAILAGSGYLGGNMILALAQLNHPSYSPALWQGTLVYWGVMVVAILIIGYASKILPKLESFMLVLHILGFFAILVPLVSVSTEYVPMQSPVIDGR